MPDPAIKPMSLDEFLRWDDGTDTRYELLAGRCLPLERRDEASRILTTRLGVTVDRALSSRRPCNAQISAGVIPPHLSDTFLIADVAATCAPIEFGRQAIEEPFLIIEVLSPSTERHDRRIKLPAYRQIDSVQEIMLIASDGVYAEVHRRAGPQWITEILRRREAVLALASVPIEIRLADLYEGISLPADEDE
jgi:Uma2 family endonuclease